MERRAIRDKFGRRTPEGVAPGAVGNPIVTGATALGFAITAAYRRHLAVRSALWPASRRAVGDRTVGQYIALTGLHVFTLLGGPSLVNA